MEKEIYKRTSTWFISDLHIGHNNVLRFEEGLHNFKDIKDHDHTIAKNWHETVGQEDHVFFLGDLAMERTKLKHIRENLGKFGKLPGKIHWIIGNHDLHINQEWLNNLGEIMDIVEFTVYKEILVEGECLIEPRKIVLFHYHSKKLLIEYQILLH
jgi:calcineurin-like phosphoesterase family protein